MKPKMITETALTIEVDDLHGRLDRALSLLANAKNQCWEKGYINLFLRVEDDGGDRPVLRIDGSRPETEKETQARVRKAFNAIERRKRTKEQNEALVENRERKQLEKLKAKYENNP